MSRIQKLETIYKEKLKDHKVDHVSNFINSILNADITKGKYARFLIESFLNDKFLEEDLIGGLESTVGQAISLFDKHKSKLPVNKRSVYSLDKETRTPLYQSPGDLWNSVKQYQGELSGKELKKEEQEKIYRETEFIYKDKKTGFQIVSPLTEKSAKWWGKGTRWCTSAENNNAFWNYADKAPLLILLMPGGEKLQLWKGKNNIQFMDVADNNVKIDYIKKNWTVLEPLCLWLKDLRYIPEELRDYNLCLEAIKQTGRSLPYVPNKHKDYNMYLEAVKQNGYTLKDIPEEFRDYNLCLEAIKNNGYALPSVPKEHRDYNLCLEVVKKNSLILRELSENYIDYALCLESVQQNGGILRFIPKEHRDYNICLEAVKQFGRALSSVPEEHRDYSLCLEAVKNNGEALIFVPKEYRDYNLCFEAVKNNKEALSYVPDKYKDKLQDKDKKYINKINKQIPEDKYEQVFSEIRSIFPEKELFLKL